MLPNAFCGRADTVQCILQTPRYCPNHSADAQILFKHFCGRPNTVQTILRTPGYCPNHSADAQILFKPFCGRPDTVQTILRTPGYCPNHSADARILSKPLCGRRTPGYCLGVINNPVPNIPVTYCLKGKVRYPDPINEAFEEVNLKARYAIQTWGMKIPKKPA